MEQQRVERRLAAILAVDVAGYSRLAGSWMQFAAPCAIQRGMVLRNNELPPDRCIVF